MTNAQLEFSRLVSVERLAQETVYLALEADSAQRKALAKRLGLIALDALKAEVTLDALAEDGRYRLAGRLVADVIQTCVLTLDPVENHIEADFSREYANEAVLSRFRAMRLGQDKGDFEEDETADWLMTLEDEEEPDPLVNNAIDAGEAVAEELALSLDPYPRKPGASLPPEYRALEEDGGMAPRHSPFAVLKDKLSGKPKT